MSEKVQAGTEGVSVPSHVRAPATAAADTTEAHGLQAGTPGSASTEPMSPPNVALASEITSAKTSAPRVHSKPSPPSMGPTHTCNRHASNKMHWKACDQQVEVVVAFAYQYPYNLSAHVTCTLLGILVSFHGDELLLIMAFHRLSKHRYPYFVMNYFLKL